VSQFLSVGVSSDENIYKMVEKLEKSYSDNKEVWKAIVKDKDDFIQFLRDELNDKRKEKTRPADD
jgi:hypothetical protein